MPSCVMRNCHNYAKKSNKTHGITYHKFPSDVIVCQDWIAIVRLQRCEHDWQPTGASTICSDHFDSENKYTSAKGRILLKKTAVPFLKKHVIQPPRCDSPNSLEEVDISDMTPYFESPKEFALKKQVSQLVEEKEIIQKKNKLLKGQNNRLKKKINSMKASQKILKRKLFIRTAFDGAKPKVIQSKVATINRAAPKVIKSEVTTSDGPAPKVIKSEVTTIDGFAPKVIKSEVTTSDGPAPKVIKSEVTTNDGLAPKLVKSEVTTIDGAAPKVVKSEVATIDGFAPKVIKSEVTTSDGPAPKVIKSEVATINRAAPKSDSLKSQ